MRFFILFFLFCLGIDSTISAQTRGCNDSINNIVYSTRGKFSSYIAVNTYTTIDNSNDLVLQVDSVTFAGDNVFSIGYQKFNEQNKLSSFTIFKQPWSNTVFDYRLAFADSKNALIYRGGEYTSAVDIMSTKGSIIKIDNNNNMLWQKQYATNTNEPDEYYSISKAVLGQNNDIIALLSNSIFDKGGYRITLLDENGKIKWAKKYFPGADADNGHILFNGKEIIFLSQFYYTDIKTGFVATRIDYQTGNIIESKAYKFDPDIESYTWGFKHILNNLNYDTTTKRYMMDFWPDYRYANGLLVFTFDSSFNYINGKLFTGSSFGNYNFSPTVISKNNKLAAIQYDKDKNKLNYTVINENLNIVTQKEIIIPGTLFVNAPGATDVTPIWRNNGSLDFHFTFTYVDGTKTNTFLLNSFPFFTTDKACFEKDAPLPVTTTRISVLPLNITSSTEDFTMKVTELPLLSGETKQADSLIICKQISICDTIKLHGDTTFCLSNSSAKFTIYKNSQCLRKTLLQVDTNALKIISQSNDTTFIVQFLKPYHGKIYASFEGCDLKDSLIVTVTAPKQKFAINKDSLLCPGKNIVLSATAGFAKYLWQDGSTQNNFVVTKPGFYKVTVTDSCNNIFMDSTTVSFIDTSFLLPHQVKICLTDTAYIHLPAGISDVIWQPANSSLLNNNILALFPTQTTAYNITIKRQLNCISEKSIKVNVDVCPETLFMPTSFTPNSDGLNDILKPTFTGRLKFYHFILYNRWGQKLFESNTATQGWDGTYKGIAQEHGAYIWYCTYQFKNKPIEIKKGTCILLH